MGVDFGPARRLFQRLQGLPASRQIRCNGVAFTLATGWIVGLYRPILNAVPGGHRLDAFYFSFESASATLAKWRL
jgi:hypothetical protein